MSSFNVANMLFLLFLIILLYYIKKNYVEFFRKKVVLSINSGHIKKGFFYNRFIFNRDIKEQIYIVLGKYYLKNNMANLVPNEIEKIKNPIYKSILLEELVKYYVYYNNVEKVDEVLETNIKPQYLNNLYKKISQFLIKNNLIEKYANKLLSGYFVEELAYSIIEHYINDNNLEKAQEIFEVYPNCYQKGKNLLKLVKAYKKVGKRDKAYELINSYQLVEREGYLNRYKVASFAFLEEFDKAIESTLNNDPRLCCEELGIVLDYIYSHNFERDEEKIYDILDKKLEEVEDSSQKEKIWIEFANIAIGGDRVDKVKEYTDQVYNSIMFNKHSFRLHDTAKLLFYLKEYERQVFLVDILAKNRVSKISENEIKGINIALWGDLLEEFIKFIAQSEVIIEDQNSLSYQSFLQLVEIFSEELDEEEIEILESLAKEIKDRDELLYFILEYIKLIKIKLAGG